MYEMSEKKRKELETEINNREDVSMKYADLDFKGKLVYIWDYYKLPIITTIIVAIFVISIGSTVITNLNKQQLLDMTVISSGYEPPVASQLMEDWEVLLHDDEGKKNQYVLVEHINISENLDPTSQLTYSSKLTAKMTANMVDLMLMEQSFFEDNAPNEMFEDLMEYVDLEALGVPEENWYYANNKVVAINVTDLPGFEGFVLTGNDTFLGIYISSGHKDNAARVIESLYE